MAAGDAGVKFLCRCPAGLSSGTELRDLAGGRMSLTVPQPSLCAFQLSAINIWDVLII